MGRLEGKRALIAGGTSGIGLAAAQRLIAAGARVAVTGTNAARLAATRSALGDGALVIDADAGDVPAQQVIADAVAKAFWQARCSFSPRTSRGSSSAASW